MDVKFIFEGITSAIKCVRNIESIKNMVNRRYVDISCGRDKNWTKTVAIQVLN